MELGTVTPLPQPGNPKPRMYRLVSHGAIINRMGFNSVGLDAFLAGLQSTTPGIIRGINIGKNAATPLKDATGDYLSCLERVYPHADYIAINISSPNTRDLRTLQEGRALDGLLEGGLRQRLGTRHPARQTGTPRAQAGAGPGRPGDRRHCGAAARARHRRGGGHQHHGVPGGCGGRPGTPTSPGD